MENTNRLGAANRFSEMVNSFGMPRLIIAGFLLAMLIVAPFVGADFATQITNIVNRFSWNAILVLAMVPMIHSGCGLNFGLPLGIISGLLGATLSIEFGFTGAMSFVMAVVIATPFAILFGCGYGWLLNKIKGGEMMIATYVGFSSVSFMCMMWLLLPYHSPTMVWGLSGKGLRVTISLEGFYDKILANFLKTPKTVANEKIKKSEKEDAIIELDRTEDILAFLGTNKKDGQFICGFSMETQNMLENSRAKLAKKNVDMIVANNLKVEGAGFGTETNVVTMITAEEVTELPMMTKEQVAVAILDKIQTLTKK